MPRGLAKEQAGTGSAVASTKTHRRHDWAESLRTLAVALLMAVAVRTFLIQPFWIPSGSMKETLLVGDFLFVNKFAYGWSRWSCPWGLCPIEGRLWGALPERGDIVVFRHPVTGEDYVKRLIGLPGDRVRMRGGHLQLNGQPVDLRPYGQFSEPYLPQSSAQSLPRCSNRPRPGAECTVDRSVETLPNGVSYPVLNITDVARGDTTQEVVVPAGHVFVLGDNRDNSLDSRFAQAQGGVGFVPLENLIGRADRVLFSSAGSSLWAFWTWRGDRFLHAVH